MIFPLFISLVLCYTFEKMQKRKQRYIKQKDSSAFYSGKATASRQSFFSMSIKSVNVALLSFLQVQSTQEKLSLHSNGIHAN